MENNRYKRPMTMLSFTVTAIRYQCGRLLKYDTTMLMSNNHETRGLHTVLPSSQLLTLLTKKKGVLADSVQLQTRHRSEVY